jgi:hypothetical protein
MATKILEKKCEICLRNFTYIYGKQRRQKNDAYVHHQMCEACDHLYYKTHGWTDPRIKKDLQPSKPTLDRYLSCYWEKKYTAHYDSDMGSYCSDSE